jgi:hypothetical protein
MEALIFILIFFVLYFIPGLVAENRRHSSRGAIIALNLLLGWTVLGWIIALVWSLTGNVERRRAEPIPAAPPAWLR